MAQNLEENMCTEFKTFEVKLAAGHNLYNEAKSILETSTVTVCNNSA